MLTLAGDATQTRHHIFQIDVVAEGHLLLDVDRSDIGCIARNDGRSRRNLDVDHLVRRRMPARGNGTNAREQLALFIKQLDTIPQYANQFGDILAIIEGDWKERGRVPPSVASLCGSR